MQTRTDRNYAVELNASVHTQIIGVTQVCAWPITAEYDAARRCNASVVKVVTSAALRS